MAEALIFDIDGTLLDSVDLHGRAWQESFAHFGLQVTFQEARSQVGKGGDQILPMFLSKEQLDRFGKELQEYRAKLFKDRYLSQVKAFPGVRELFQKALSNGQKLALASSARGDELKHYEEIAGVEDLVHVETSSADAERSKPHPDIFEVALERLGPISKDQVVVIGDSPHDAEAARRAGLRCVGVLCGGFPEADLREAGAMAIYAGPEDLLKRYDSSPLAKTSSAHK
jgi:HAD superfamily hydrolase (TIGR01549 family)